MSDIEYDELVKTKSRKKLKLPQSYKVLLHNDNYTTMEFVVFVLETVFSKSLSEATRIMLHVHNNGIGVCGSYSYDCLLYTSPSPRDQRGSRMPSSA